MINSLETWSEMISAYESYITLEMQLRDYDMDGRVTRDEFDQHQIDYSE